MKKTLVALAALAVVGAASAQSTVTLYGKVGLGLRSVTKEANAAKGGAFADVAGSNVGLQMTSGREGGSRWGLKGSEDLGGGMTANFQLEQGFQADSGLANDATRQFSRLSWVGLAGGFGAFTMGEQYNVADNVWCNMDALYCYSGTASGYAWNGGAHTDVSSGQTPANMFQYKTPNMGGFTGLLQYAPGENKGVLAGQSAGNYWGAQVDYANGPISVTAGYERTRRTSTGTANLSIATSTVAGQGAFNAPVAGAVGVTSDKNWAIGVGYDFGMAKVIAGYERGDNSAGAEDRGWQIGAVIPISTMTLQVSWAREKQESAAGFDGKQTAIGAHLTYPFSKRTTFYVEAFGGKKTAATAAQAETKDRIFGLGIKHDF